MVQAMLKENLGVNITLRPLDADIYNTDRGEGKIDFGIDNWEFDYVDPSNFLNIYQPESPRTAQGWWNNAEFNELTEEGSRLGQC